MQSSSPGWSDHGCPVSYHGGLQPQWMCCLLHVLPMMGPNVHRPCLEPFFMTVFQSELHLLCHRNYASCSDVFGVTESSKAASPLRAVSGRALAHRATAPLASAGRGESHQRVACGVGLLFFPVKDQSCLSVVESLDNAVNFDFYCIFFSLL